MRAVLCDKKFEELLGRFGASYKLAVGLIIGQTVASGKDFIVHLAKTPHSDTQSNVDDDVDSELLKITDLDNKQVAEHALNALRMIVGGFNILGLFVVSESNIFSDNSALQKLKTVFMDIKVTLDSNGLLFANTDALDDGNKLLLNYITGQKSFVCKTISTDPSKAPSASPVDWKFVAKATDWFEFEAVYEVDTVFPLPHATNHFDTEKYIMETINKISEDLNKSIIFFNGEPKNKEMTVDKLMAELEEATENVKVTIYNEASKLATSENGVLKQHESMVRYTGIVDSRVYGSSRNSIAEIESYIREDVIRSITTRLQIYYDALLANDDGGNDNENGQDQDVNSTIPPRRVFFPIGNGKISFSDYLFQYENEETTVKQSMDVLGIDLPSTEVVTNAEANVQLKHPEKSEILSNPSDEFLFAKNDTAKLLILVGIIGLVVALFVSIVLHFLIN